MERRTFVGGLVGSAIAGVPVLGTVLSDRLGVGFDGPFDVSVSIDHEADSPVELEATLRDRQILRDSPAALEFSVRNVSDEQISLSSGVPGPFGVLQAGDSGPLLWSSAYDDHSGVQIDLGGLRTSVAEVALERSLAPGERVSERYELRSSDPRLRAGRFEVTSVNDDFPGQYGSAVTAELTIERA